MARTYNTLPYDLYVEHPSTLSRTIYYTGLVREDCDCRGPNRQCRNGSHRRILKNEDGTWRYEPMESEHPIGLKWYRTGSAAKFAKNNRDRRERRAVKRMLDSWDDDEFSGLVSYRRGQWKWDVW